MWRKMLRKQVTALRILSYMNVRRRRMRTDLSHVRDSFEMVNRGKERRSGD
jgi:hypothetical protein